MGQASSIVPAAAMVEAIIMIFKTIIKFNQQYLNVKTPFPIKFT